jgi:hypothetical protein
MPPNNDLEKRLWAAADQLRANSSLTAQEYSRPVSILLCSLLLLPMIYCQPLFAGVLDDLASSVVFIETRTVGQSESKVGTGFFALRNARMFLVTAGHVARSTNAGTTVTIRTEGDKPLQFRIQEISGKQGDQKWINHRQADISVLSLEPSPEVSKHFSEHFLPMNLFPEKLAAPSRDRPLTVLGFPLGLGVKEKFSPISKECKPASGLLPLARFDNQQETSFFLLDSPSIGGFSGAPVFLLPGTFSRSTGSASALVFSKKLQCVGVVHGTISDKTGGKMAAITPSWFVVETLEKAIATIQN